MNKFKLNIVTNANEFAFLAENREIIANKRAKEKLENSIIEKGILQPVTVMAFDINNPDHLLKDGKPHLLAHPDDTTEIVNASHIKYLILDGAHRFVLATANGIEIPILVNENLDRSDIISMNNLATKWQTDSYVKCYAKLGMIDYINLDKVAKKWRAENFKSLTDVAIQYSDSLNASASEEIKGQNYKFNQEKGDSILNTCNKFKAIPDFSSNKLYNHRIFMTVIGQLIRKYNSAFIVDEIIQHILINDLKLHEKGKRGDRYKEDLESIMDKIVDGNGDQRLYTQKQKTILGKRSVDKAGINNCKKSGCSIIGLDNLEVDHKVAYNGFNTTLKNAQLLCPTCNKEKSNMDYAEWVEKFQQ